MENKNKPFNISELFFSAAAKHPNNTAIIEGNEAITYIKLKNKVESTAHYFLKKGIKKGDRVLVFVPMSIDLYRIVLALFKIGAVAVFLDEWVTKERMEMCCKIANCKGFIGITKSHLLRFFSKELKQIPIVLKIRSNISYVTQYVNEQTTLNDTALITFTTGSTGTPKAAKRTHVFLHAQFAALSEKINPQPTDVDMCLLPIVLLVNLGVGACSVIAKFKSNKPKAFNPKNISQQINYHNVNRITASPFFLKLLSVYLIHSNQKLLSIKNVFTGGAPVFPNEAEIFVKAFDKSTIEIVYGSTEAEPISSINALKLVEIKKNTLVNGLLVGIPYHKAEVRIINITEKSITANNEAELLICPKNTVGEIIVAGPHVLKEYFNNEEAFKKNKIIVQQKVYHRTGDSGYLDKDGNLFLTGRCSGIFQINGQQIYPFVYENYFQNTENVNLGTVLLMNSQVTAVLQLNRFSEKQKTEISIQKLALRIDNIIYIKKMPRDLRHNSKIDYEKLKQLLNC